MSAKNDKIIIRYTEDIKAQFESGHAKEHAYRPALKELMTSFDNVLPINEPKKSEFGNPDFVFRNKTNNDIEFGYAEAKDIDINLNKVENTEQLQRYGGYEKLFLTNYLEFRFFINGSKYETVSIGKIADGKLILDPDNFSRLIDVIDEFLKMPPEKIKSGKRLAEIMGAKARRIRDNLKVYLVHEEDERNQELEKMYSMMKELLVHDLSPEKFADMYAQTLVYGLFVARYSDKTPDNFTRTESRDLVPASNPFLREFFDHIVGPRFDKRLAFIVDELCEVFSVSDVNSLVHQHLRLFEIENEKDPIIHFYEDFLREYDPNIRKQMGAYYTPLPVVKFIIKAIDELLKKEFNVEGGLSNTQKKSISIERQGKKHKIDVHRIQILDPAVGTATFLNETIKHIRASFKGQEGRWKSYVVDDLLPRIYGFELMMAPYTIAHLKLGMTLKDSGIDNLKNRLGVFLTNTLEEGVKKQPDLFSYGLAEVVSHEAEEAGRIKHEKPIMVIMGNPPYSGESSNKTAFAQGLVEKYKFEPGGTRKLQERNPKWINDDYVKFIAFAEDMISKTGEGIVGMITNHAYLDNPTFRGMRWHLAKTFDKIYILDLHGNSKKKEVCPDGTKDENVFDIMQGVAIILAVKKNKKKSSLAEVFHTDIWGTRKKKYEQLQKTAGWKKLNLDKTHYYFINKSTEGKVDYDKGVAVNDLFNINSVGIVTAADSTLVSLTPRELLGNLSKIVGSDSQNIIAKKINGEIDSVKVKPIAYRPFDIRFIYYDASIIERPREKVMKNYLEKENVGLMLCRQQKTDGFSHVLIHDKIVESSYVSNKTSEIGYSYPLYVFHDDGTKTPNFNPNILKEFTKNLSNTHTPEEILDYIYAVLHSSIYRGKYKEFLKSDFPKIPQPASDLEFKKLCAYGEKLRNLHLLKTPNLSEYITTYPAQGENDIDKVEYKDNRVFINGTQYFGNVPEIAWNFYIGAYQPAQKWLKDRVGRTLTSEDIEHYQKIIVVLTKTSSIMSEIDKIFTS